jgi:hypothetical protein
LHEALDRYGAANPTVDDLLTNHDITPSHRQALEYKRDWFVPDPELYQCCC